MVWRMWLRMSIVSVFLLAGCVQPTPTPAGTGTPQSGYPSYPPTETSLPSSYPSGDSTPTAPAGEATQPSVPYPAPTTGAAARLGPL